MKRLLKGLSLLLSAAMLSGCMKMNMTISVDEKGKTKTSVDILASEQVITASNTTDEKFVASLKEQFTANNKDVSAHKITKTEGNTKYVGIRASNDLSSSIKTDKKNGRLYVKIPMSSFTSALSDNNLTTDTLKEFNADEASLKKNGVEMKIVINMPEDAKTNVGTVKGKKVTIDLLNELFKDKKKQVKTITVSSKIPSPIKAKDIWMIAGGAVLIIAIVLFALRSKRSSQPKKDQ